MVVYFNLAQTKNAGTEQSQHLNVLLIVLNELYTAFNKLGETFSLQQSL
jgi:hypothetical protein